MLRSQPDRSLKIQGLVQPQTPLKDSGLGSRLVPLSFQGWDSVYPVFGLYVPNQSMVVDFQATLPTQ